MQTTLPSRLRPACHLAACAAALFLHVASVHGIILYSTGDPTANTTAPTGPLAGSGWQYQGQFSSWLGTPISSQYFVTAAHLRSSTPVGTPIIYQGVSYVTTARYEQPGSDLAIYRIDGTFPTYAPLYTNPSGTLGLSLVVFGRGTQRGAEVLVGPDNHLGGWGLGTSDNVQRWGTNNVGAVYNDPNYGRLLYAPFNANGSAYEAHLTVNDSGGGVFIQDPSDSVWKLAGINLGVDGPFARSSNGAGAFNAALFDTTGLYEYNGDNQPYVRTNDGPSGFYATEIAGQLGYINSIVPEPVTSLWLAGAAAAGLAYRHARRRAVR